MQMRIQIRSLAGMLAAGGLILSGCNLQAPQAPPLTPTAISLPTGTGPAGQSVIFGVVWEDRCTPESEAEALSEGCIDPDGSGPRANGIFEANEPGLPGVTVHLGQGACPASGAAEIVTDEQGRYEFAGLSGGEYCVSIDAAAPANVAALGEGIWTSPPGAAEQATITASASLGEASGEQIDIGWDPGGGVEPVASATPTATVTPTQDPALTPTLTPDATGTVSPTPDPNDPAAGLGDPDLSDTFETGSSWPVYQDEHVRFAVAEGRLEMTAFNADFWDGWIFPSSATQADFYAEGEFEFGICSGRDNLGLIGRGDCPGGVCRAYLFAATCDGRYNLRIWDGASTTYLVPLTQIEAVPGGSNSTVRLGLWMQGSTIRLYANGIQLAEIQDSAYNSGDVGVFIGAAVTANFQATLDNFRYWSLP